MTFDDSEMPNTPRDSWADHLLMTWLAKLLAVTLFCVVVKEGSRSAPCALHVELNPDARQVTALFKPNEMYYDLESGGVDFASEKGSSVNGAGLVLVLCQRAPLATLWHEEL